HPVDRVAATSYRFHCRPALEDHPCNHGSARTNHHNRKGIHTMARGSDIKEARIKWVTEHDLVPDEARKAFENAETLTVPAPLPISELAKKAVSKSGLDHAEMLLAIVGGTSPHTLHNLEGELREHYRRDTSTLFSALTTKSGMHRNLRTL